MKTNCNCIWLNVYRITLLSEALFHPQITTRAARILSHLPKFEISISDS